MIINFAESALADLENIMIYYQQQGVESIGTEFVSTIIEHIQVLETHPKLGRIVPEFNRQSIREIIHKPFRIVYLCEPNSIDIIRVYRSERQLELENP